MVVHLTEQDWPRSGAIAVAARRRSQLGGSAARWQVISRAGVCIARLGQTEIAGSVAGWLLRSVDGDLVYDARRARRSGFDPAPDDPTGDDGMLARHRWAPHAEDGAIAGPLMSARRPMPARRGALAA